MTVRSTRWRIRSDRRFSPRRARGVSPIIATILLVAITVVLASILYVLVSGLSHGGVLRPSIGTAFEITSPVAGTCWTAGVTSHICGKVGNRLFNFTVQTASSVTLGDILLVVKTPTGSVYSNPNAGAFAVMKLGLATPLAYYTFAVGAGLAMTSQFTYNAGYSSGTEITSIMYVVIGTGTSASSWTPGQGNEVVAYGMNHYSGQTLAQTLP